MNQPRPTSARRRRRRASHRWHLPPPLIHGATPLEGGAILQEWPNEVGVLLWQRFRDVMLWAMAEPGARHELFAEGAAAGRHAEAAALSAEGTLPPAFQTLSRIVQEPDRMEEAQVARACRALSEWADEQGAPGTALAFAQDAALVTPADPGAAFWVATLAVRLNDQARAEIWFRRAVGLARRRCDWRMYARSFSGLGHLYVRRGNLPTARKLHLRALRGARRGGVRQEQAFALHDLFALAVETRNALEAEELARQALRAYGTRSRRLPVLAHDLAYFWMEQGYFARALSVFQAVLPLIERPIEKLFILANITRAAAGSEDAITANTAADTIWSRVDDPLVERGIARALLEVSRADLILGQYEAAERAARTALEKAIAFREHKVQFDAEALLDEAVNQRVEAASSCQNTEILPDYLTGDELAHDFVATLQTMAGAAS